MQVKKKAVSKKNQSLPGEMGILEHLGELRKRLFIIVTVFFVVTIASFNFSDDIVGVLVETAIDIGYQMVYIAPGELFTQYIKISVITGLVVSSPVIFFQIWMFVRPALKSNEKSVVFLTLLAGLLCFVIGALFAYFIVVPITLTFFRNVDNFTMVQPTITIQNYITFVITTLLTFGIVFEMPVVTVLLSELGLLKPEWLTGSRKMVIVVVFVIAAIITPPDVISQTLVAFPMLLLFEVSIALSKMIGKRKKRRTKEEELDDED